jgi:uncharacterized protein (DUF1697 family)
VPAYVALLRGINVGRSRRISMPELRDALEQRGFGRVQTYVQSGNVVLNSDASPDVLARTLEAAIEDRFGLDDVPVMVRSGAELARIVKLDPLRELVSEDRLYQVTFLSEEPSPEVADRLRAAPVEPEALHLSGRELYSWHPRGAQDSKLWRLLASPALGVHGTSRNWRTVTTLLKMSQSLSG